MYFLMNRYFSISIGGLPSDSDASIGVDSFSEIKEMLDCFSKEIPHRFVKYKTQLIMNKPPEKFPHWDKVYMVKAVLEDGHEIPVGYCNFKKTFFSSISIYSIAMAIAFLSSIAMSIRYLILHNGDIALLSGIVAVLVGILSLNKHTTTMIKLQYLMK